MGARWQRTCLNPRFSLRTQMFLSFGMTAIIALSSFLAVGIYAAWSSGRSVRDEARVVVTDLVKHSLSTTSQYVAQTMTKKFSNIGGAGSLIAEATRDRFVGYPNLEDLENDAHVPFWDTNSGFNVYPLNGPPLPLEWEIVRNVNEDNANLHLPDRPFGWYQVELTNVSTIAPSYYMQGLCNPDITDPGHPAYYPDCTSANNDIRLGGVRKPTPVNFHLYNKSKDLGWLLKPLFESHTDVKTVGMFFANAGAGSVVQYPSTVYDGTQTFTSIGCDWMTAMHPHTNESIATPEEIQRCHSKGETVTMREYNPLERGWCRDQVLRDIELANGLASLASENVIATGPYLDALSTENLWVMTFGRAIFDRLTHAFLGCALVDVSVEKLFDILRDSAKVGNTSESALIRWDQNGTVVVASHWDPNVEVTETTVTNSSLKLGIAQETYKYMREEFNYTGGREWDPAEELLKYQDTFFENDNRLIMIHPVPGVPKVYDKNYRPEYMVVLSIEESEAFGLVDEMGQIIDDDVIETWKGVGLVAGVGLGVVILSITYIAYTLTKPLRWMQRVAGLIIDNAGGQDLKKGLAEEMESSDAHPWCAPRTEVTYLLEEFEKMINGFSGEGAADVAGLQVSEVQNRFEWRRLYESLYPWNTSERRYYPSHDKQKEDDPAIPSQLSIRKTHSHDTHDTMFEDELTTESTLNTGQMTRGSILSSIVNTATSTTITNNPTVSSVISRVTPMVNSVRGYAVKAGLMKEPEKERIVGPPKVHHGSNIVIPADPMKDYFDAIENTNQSFLFWYTTILVGSPILVTAILISIFVSNETTDNIPIWLGDVRDRSVEIERESIDTAALARALFGREVMARFIRDLHLYTRVAGWLLFGALQRTDSFTWTKTGADSCKVFDNGSHAELKCPYMLNETLAPCGCDWDDPRFPPGENCTNYASSLESRRMQARYYEGQADDINPRTGGRLESSFPAVGNSSEEVSWWNDTMHMPGYPKGAAAAGYETTYDRVRVLSAMSVVEFPLYNYNPGVGEKKNLASYIGFEQDGMMTGFQGCAHGHATSWPFWTSSWDNGGPILEPFICQNGKFGYDARCRGWYARGAEEEAVYVTPPYKFASGGFAATATFSLVDPNGENLVGQASLDFLPNAFLDALEKANTQIGHSTGGFPVVITPENDLLDADTLVGPGFDLETQSLPIGKVVLPYDLRDSEYRTTFDSEIVSKMKAGEEGSGTFWRTSPTTGLPEEVYLTYAPLYLRTLLPVDHRDFSAGVQSITKQLIYSVGLGITEEDLAYPFRKVQSNVNREIDQVMYISTALVIVAILLVVYMTYSMCLYISQPIVVLMGIVKSIDTKTLQDELPPLEAGSSEIFDVYDSLEKLCKLVRFSNAAFAQGDRSKSYKVLEDALELFVKMGNQKALGVANNNLGTMVLQEQMERSSTTTRSDEVYFNGMQYFEEAIRIGTYEYQNAPEDETQGDFIKQLANRYFNRGVFYIVNRNNPMAPKTLEETGVKDLMRAKALDEEAHIHWKENEELQKQARKEFHCLLRRARGMLTLVVDCGFEDVWGIEALIAEAEAMLKNPDNAHSNLFENINMVARQQQVNDLKIQYELSRGETETAARIALKMLVEDDYIIDTVLMNSVTTINKHFNLQGPDMAVPNMTQLVKRETRRGQVDSMRAAKNVIFCLDYSGSMAGERMARAQKNLIWTYDEHCLEKDYVGFVRFNHAVDDKLFFDLERKGGNHEEHHSILYEARDAEGGTRLYAALNRCVNMALDADNLYDTWIIALTDGESAWDFPAKSVIERIDKQNKQGGPRIHVIVIGFDVPSEVADSVSKITSITDKSLYIDCRGGLDSMDAAFEQVASVITGTAITMETF